MNVRGRWLRKSTIWRKISLNTWSTPDNATILGSLDLDVGPLLDWLQRTSEASGVKCTITHAVTRCLAMALRRYPECNVLVRRRRIWMRDDVDIFHQVAMPIDQGSGEADLSGAVVRKADTMTVPQISADLRQQAEAVRARKDGEMARTRSTMMALPGTLLKWVLRLLGFLSYNLNLNLPTVPRDPFGGAMVTSVAMFGLSSGFAPLVTFSRCPIIVMVGRTEQRPVVKDGQVAIRTMCTLTATIDHRVLDGFQAGILASTVKRLLEEPDLLDKDPDTIH